MAIFYSKTFGIDIHVDIILSLITHLNIIVHQVGGQQAPPVLKILFQSFGLASTWTCQIPFQLCIQGMQHTHDGVEAYLNLNLKQLRSIQPTVIFWWF